MSKATQRKKLSKGTWALIILLLVGVVAVAVLAIFGIIDLTFLGDLVVGYAAFGTVSWMNGVLIIIGPFFVGMLVCWALYRYFIGQTVTMPMGMGTGYNPMPTTPSQTQQDKETVIS